MWLLCVRNTQIFVSLQSNWSYGDSTIGTSINPSLNLVWLCCNAYRLFSDRRTRHSVPKDPCLNLFNRMFSYLSTHCNCSCCIFELNCLSRISVKNITSWLCQLPPDTVMWNYSLLWSLSLSKCRPIKTLKRRLDKSENTFIISVENTTHNLLYHFRCSGK